VTVCPLGEGKEEKQMTALVFDDNWETNPTYPYVGCMSCTAECMCGGDDVQPEGGGKGKGTMKET
jgi:hypothetical protein